MVKCSRFKINLKRFLNGFKIILKNITFGGRKMKRFWCAVLAAATLFSMTACGTQTAVSDDTDTTTAVESDWDNDQE